MNRREMLTAATGAVAGLFLPSVATATTNKRQTLAEYVRSLPYAYEGQTWIDGKSKFWNVVFCHWSEEYQLPFWHIHQYPEYSDIDGGWYFLEDKYATPHWIYTDDGAKRIDPYTTELHPFTPVVKSLKECYMPITKVVDGYERIVGARRTTPEDYRYFSLR